MALMLSGLLSPPLIPYLFLLPIIHSSPATKTYLLFLENFFSILLFKPCLNTLPLDIHKSYFLSSFMSLFKCHFLRETSLDH